jgi:uncharacterized membrane protein YhiD involved in acid resistance
MPNALKRGTRRTRRRQSRTSHRSRLAALLIAVSLFAVAAWAAQGASPEPSPLSVPESASGIALREVLLGLPIAAVLGAVLAFRPQRRGTPPRDPAVVQTQIILALVGAMVMLVVGASLARAFGIVGAASLVRYRAKIEDPKDAGVMLACLAIGLASGVGSYLVAVISTLFVLVVVSILESQEPERHKDFLLKVKAKGSGRLQDPLEALLRRNGIKYELRTASQDDLTYSVRLPLTKKTDRLTDAILDLGDKDQMTVDWSDKKPDRAAA